VSAVNKIWTILAKGKEVSLSAFGRKVSSNLYIASDTYIEMLDVLVPYNDNLLRAFRIEQLVQLLLLSSWRTQTLELDPINTYERATLTWPTAGGFYSSSPMTILMTSIPAAFVTKGTGIIETTCIINPAGTITYDGGTSKIFSYSNNLSSVVELYDGITIRLQGPLPVSSFSVNLTWVTELSTDWMGLLNNLTNLNLQWADADLRNCWDQSPLWAERLSAAVLSVAKGHLGA
jgi:hypothetical protein